MTAPTDIRYEKLPGSGQKSFNAGRCTLWLGPDHLMQVENTYGTEVYRRLYFRDIQIIRYQRTRRRGGINVALAILYAIYTWIWFTASSPSLWVGILDALPFLLCSLPLLALFLINTLKGPTCETTIFTAVGPEKVPSLRRIRRTEKVLARISPLIEQAQASIAEKIATTQTAPPDLETRPDPVRIIPPVLLEPALRHEPGGWHYGLFALFAATSLVLLLMNSTPALRSDPLLYALLLGVTALFVGAIRRHHASDIPGTTKLATWLIICHICAMFIGGFVFAIKDGIQHEGKSLILKKIEANQLPPVSLFYKVAGFPTFIRISAIVGGGICLLGIVPLFIRRKGTPAVQPPPTRHDGPPPLQSA